MLCKSGIACILDAAVTSDKLTRCSSIIQKNWINYPKFGNFLVTTCPLVCSFDSSTAQSERLLVQSFGQLFANLNKQSLKSSAETKHLQMYQFGCRVFLSLRAPVCCFNVNLALLIAACFLMLPWSYIFYIFYIQFYVENNIIWANLMLMTSAESEHKWYP